MFTMQLIVS